MPPQTPQADDVLRTLRRMRNPSHLAIAEQATDDRNYVKKAESWALRQIGKRSPGLHAAAVSTARQILALDDRAPRWIARDALRELESAAIRERMRRSKR